MTPCTIKRIIHWSIIGLSAILVVIMYVWQQYRLKGTNERLSKLLSDSVTFVTQINGLNQTVSVQKQNIITLEEAVKAGKVTEQQLKADNISLLQMYAEAKEIIISLHNELVAYSDTQPPVIVTFDSTDYMKIPQRFSKNDDKWYSVSGTVQKNGVLFDSIAFVSSPSFTVGYQKDKNWFKRLFNPPTPVVIYKNDNPYAKTVSMDNVVVLKPKRWYERNIFWFLSGAILTGTVTYLITK